MRARFNGYIAVAVCYSMTSPVVTTGECWTNWQAYRCLVVLYNKKRFY